MASRWTSPACIIIGQPPLLVPCAQGYTCHEHMTLMDVTLMDAALMRISTCTAMLLAALILAVPTRAQNILIGVSTPATGPAAIASEWDRWGIDLAREEINAAGGVLDRKLETMALDNWCNPSEAVNVANRLVEAKVVAIIGAHCSSAHLASMPIVKDAKVPMITGIACNPQITDESGVGGNDWAFRINPSDKAMMDAIGAYLGSKKIFNSVAIVAEDSDFGRGGATAFQAVAEKAGITILSTDFHPQNAPDYTSILTRLQQRRPDAIATFQLGGDSLNFLRNAMQMGLRIPYTGRVELGGRNLQIIEAGGMEGSISAWTYSAEIATPENLAFVAKIKAKHNATPYLQTWGSYDSMRIIAQAIGEAGSTDTTKVRDAMQAMKFTTVFGKQVAFDVHNPAEKYVVLQSVNNEKVAVADIVEVK
jgi:branched-chain amino acid transport system substrate-binding protein